MENMINYNELLRMVNSRYKILEDTGEQNIHQILKREFNLSTSELWECIGLKDELDFKLITYFDHF